jgi:hypothetical protein
LDFVAVLVAAKECRKTAPTHAFDNFIAWRHGNASEAALYARDVARAQQTSTK